MPFPLTDTAAAKRRPALVISSAAFQEGNGAAILVMITSAKHSPWTGDMRLRDWRAAGLPQSSVVRLKLFTLDLRFVLRKLGSLSAKGRRAVRERLEPYLTL